MLKLWTIAGNAFLETIRQPIYLILLYVTWGIIVVLEVPLAGYSMGNQLVEGDNRMLVDFGLSTLMIGGLMIAAFSASSVLSREIDRRTVLTVVSKPVSRPTIFGGKLLGVAAAVTVAFYLSAVVFTLWTRHGVLSRAGMEHDWVVISLWVGALVGATGFGAFCNYFFGWQFIGTKVLASLVLFTVALVVTSFVDKGWVITPFGEALLGRGLTSQVFVVVLLIWMATMVMTAIATAVSTRLSQMATLAVCLGVFLASLVIESVCRPYIGENALAMLVYKAAPNLVYFFALDALTMDQQITAAYVGWAGAYAALYAAAATFLGIALLQTREMEAREASSTAPGMVNAFAWAMRLVALAAIITGAALLAGRPDWQVAKIGSALTVGGIGGWWLAGLLGRGRRWALLLLLFLTAVQFVLSIIYALSIGTLSLSLRPLVLVSVSTAITAYVTAMVFSRAAREHFAIRRRRPALS